MSSVFVVAAAILLFLLEIQTSASHSLHKCCTTVSRLHHTQFIHIRSQAQAGLHMC